jgi:hypothetical protein
MDIATLKTIVTNISTETGNDRSKGEYHNDAEHLRSLHNWVHNAKEAGHVDEAMQAFIDESGLEGFKTCMGRNKGDTIIANRVLEVVAGERYSNGSLPFLEDKQACSKLVDLGYVELLMEVLKLPDLQAISRSLACRAIRELCSNNQSVIQNVVNRDGVSTLMEQIFHVDRGFAFAALSVLARYNPTARDQIRNSPKSLKHLLRRFSEKPNDYSPEEDPAAALLFVKTWSWDETHEQLQIMGGKNVVSESHDVLKTAYIKEYKTSNWAADTLFPCSEFLSEVGNCYFFIKTGKFAFLAVSVAGMLFHTVMSTNTMKKPPIWKVMLNILTLGYYNLAAEGQVCYEKGLRTDTLIGLKMFKGINAMIRFYVGTYSFLLAGYADGFARLTGMQEIVRWVSIGTSLFFLPLAGCDLVMARTVPGKREFGHSFMRWARRPGLHFGLLAYQGSEIWAQVTLVIFQMVAEPVGMYVCWAVHISLLMLATLIMGRCSCNRYTFVNMPMALFWTTNGGGTAELKHMSRAGSLLRVLSLGACWAWIALRLRTHHHLVHHLTSSKSCMALAAIALLGTVVHFFSYLLQIYNGRWYFDNMDYLKFEESDLEMKLMADGGRADEAAALYDTAGEAPFKVADRWKQVHELLDTPTARVPCKQFLAVHQTLAKSAAPNRDVTDESPYMDFMNALFVAATGLMLPKKKDDLGKHCFGYSSLISDEYYESSEKPDKLGLLSAPAIGWFDPLKVMRLQLKDDWSKVQKDEQQHVNVDSFKQVLRGRHLSKLGGITEAIDSFDQFLERIFEAMRRISGCSDRDWIDQHGFVYGGVLAYEFYFADARDHERAEGCGSSTPVADNLGITVPLPAKKSITS